MTLAQGADGRVWVGTSYGRLFRLEHDMTPLLVAELRGVRINGIAPTGDDRVWIATSDGVRCIQLDNHGTCSTVCFRSFYQEDPVFVSSAYVPEDNSDRVFGEVEDIIAWRDEESETVVAISAAYGVLEYLPRFEVWQHCVRRYKEPKFDTRELIPHRRPLCGYLDDEGTLWLGTLEDGIVRLPVSVGEDSEAGGRVLDPSPRRPVVYPFDKIDSGVSRANDIVGSTRPDRIWCLVRGTNGYQIARFDSGRWEVRNLDWQPDPNIATPSLLRLFTHPTVVEVGANRLYYEA